MMGAVLDACAVVPLFIQSPLTDEAEMVARPFLAGSTAPVVPHLFHYEVANAVWTYVRTARISANQAMEIIQTLETMPLEIRGNGILIRRSLELACVKGLTVYDCCYLELAKRLNYTLVTADRRLAEVAVQEGVEVAFISPKS